MEIRTVQQIIDENGNEVLPGTVLMFTTPDGCSYYAKLKGINERNNLVFVNPMTGEEFPKKPSSIIATRRIDLDVKEES